MVESLQENVQKNKNMTKFIIIIIIIKKKILQISRHYQKKKNNFFLKFWKLLVTFIAER